MTVDDIIDGMRTYAVRQADGSGHFYGSPRQLMEVPGVSTSSGRLYHGIRSQGIVQYGTRRNAVWVIPPELM